MNCPACNAALEKSPNGAYARCTACGKLYMTYGGELRPVQIPPGTDPAVFAAGVGFSAPGGGGPALPPDPMTATKNAFMNKASNMGVRVKVAGVNVDLDKNGVDVDTAGLAKKVERKVEQKISQWIFGCIFSLIFGAVVIGVIVLLVGYIGFEVFRSTGGGPATEAEWDGKSTFTCPSGAPVTLSGVTADVKGTAIDAGGNCKLTLEDMDITGDVAIDVGGNAQVTIKGGHVKGRETSITVGGNGQVVVDGATVEGPTKKGGNGKIQGL